MNKKIKVVYLFQLKIKYITWENIISEHQIQYNDNNGFVINSKI